MARTKSWVKIARRAERTMVELDEQKREREERALAISETEPDWSREAVGLFEWNGGKQLVRSIRLYERARARGVPRFLLIPIVVLHRFWSVVSGADIPLGSRVGGGLVLPHPNGIVVHPDAEVGVNCAIFQGVTLGYGPRPGLPRLEGQVDVGAGAKILGGIVVGARARIGANAVVIDDVPPGATAVGIPARVLPARIVAGVVARSESFVSSSADDSDVDATSAAGPPSGNATSPRGGDA